MHIFQAYSTDALLVALDGADVAVWNRDAKGWAYKSPKHPVINHGFPTMRAAALAACIDLSIKPASISVDRARAAYAQNMEAAE